MWAEQQQIDPHSAERTGNDVSREHTRPADPSFCHDAKGTIPATCAVLFFSPELTPCLVISSRVLNCMSGRHYRAIDRDYANEAQNRNHPEETPSLSEKGTVLRRIHEEQGAIGDEEKRLRSQQPRNAFEDESILVLDPPADPFIHPVNMLAFRPVRHTTT